MVKDVRVMKLTVRKKSHWMNVKMAGKLSTNQEASLVFVGVALWDQGKNLIL